MYLLLLWSCSGKDADTGTVAPDTDVVDFDPDADEAVEEEREDDTARAEGDDTAAGSDSGGQVDDTGGQADDTGSTDELIPGPYASCDGEETWDFDLDGADDIYYRSYDENGDLTDYDKDDDADGSIDVTRTYTYTAGRETGAWYDEDGDGWWDYAIYTSYDADGLPLSKVYDADADTTEDQRYDYVNFDGRVQEAWYDADADGTVDVYYSYTYDEKTEHLLSIEGDRGGDGSVDALYTFTWTVTDDGYDAQYEESDRDEDGLVDHHDYSVYDGEGRLVEFWVDEDASGVPESHTFWTYRLDGQVASQAGDVYTGEELYYSYTATLSFDLDDHVQVEDWVFEAAGGFSFAESVHVWSCLP